MAKHKKSVSGDNALREFYEAYGLSPATIEGATGLHRERLLSERWPPAFAVADTGTSWAGSTEKVQPYASVD